MSKQLAPYEYWTANNQKNVTLLKIFIRSSVFDSHTNDSNPNFQNVNKKVVRHETYKNFWNTLPANLKKVPSSKKKIHESIFTSFAL